MKTNFYVFEMLCHNCRRKFISKIKSPVPCPYCGKMTDNTVRIVKVFHDPVLGNTYVDARTGKFLKVKTR